MHSLVLVCPTQVCLLRSLVPSVSPLLVAPNPPARPHKLLSLLSLSSLYLKSRQFLCRLSFSLCLSLSPSILLVIITHSLPSSVLQHEDLRVLSFFLFSFESEITVSVLCCGTGTHTRSQHPYIIRLDSLSRFLFIPRQQGREREREKMMCSTEPNRTEPISRNVCVCAHARGQDCQIHQERRAWICLLVCI